MYMCNVTVSAYRMRHKWGYTGGQGFPLSQPSFLVGFLTSVKENFDWYSVKAHLHKSTNASHPVSSVSYMYMSMRCSPYTRNAQIYAWRCKSAWQIFEEANEAKIEKMKKRSKDLGTLLDGKSK